MMPDPQEKIAQAKAAYLQAKAQICAAFDEISPDRLNWSPSPTARTPIHIMAHCATALRHITEQIDGTPFHFKTTGEADAFFRKQEQQFTTREEVLCLLEETSAKYLALLDRLTPEDLAVVRELPFSLGHAPIEFWLTAASSHTSGHVGQLQYIQTIYGDHDWYLPTGKK